jgi:hypothetical protein
VVLNKIRVQDHDAVTIPNLSEEQSLDGHLQSELAYFNTEVDVYQLWCAGW